ncbi:hypothetical protein EAX61_11620 [Dokdonia sinensis]|uniref:Uncharacterized protein n=1 Tax=Dokdonia sinensis TaxID=2479847 RepID=A0A3M0FY33_9FLAO|nr:papain-like cysteine protease family protein [Dokdonia sinensis]RMB57388.1 hypothetical protein EAX61_11620 [Dokdonia sinensis]
MSSNDLQFYCFLGMDHQAQPLNSYWCWAACLSKMIKGLNSSSQIGTAQCEIVSHYIHSFNSHNLITDDNYCCSEDGAMRTPCNIPIAQDHLCDVFRNGGFETEEINDLEIFNNYETIVSILKTFNAPIILKTRLFQQAHMILITGFGSRNHCDYLQVGNPVDNNEKYMLYENFLANIHIDNAWTAKVISEENLEQDKILVDKYKFIKESLDFIQTQKNIENPQYRNPWYYLTHLNAFSTLKYYRESNNKDAALFELELQNDFEINTNSSIPIDNCEPYVYRHWPVNFMSISQFSERVINDTDSEVIILDEKTVKIKDYGLTLTYDEQLDTDLVTVISGPLNYGFEKEAIQYTTFISRLEALPKLTAFKDNSAAVAQSQVNINFS